MIGEFVCPLCGSDLAVVRIYKTMESCEVRRTDGQVGEAFNGEDTIDLLEEYVRCDNFWCSAGRLIQFEVDDYQVVRQEDNDDV